MAESPHDTARGVVDRVVRVEESTLAIAVLRLVERSKAVIEGAGAAPLAALLSGRLDDLRGRRVVLPLCGGNIDPLTLHRVIEYGLGCDGRLHRLRVDIGDRPGGLSEPTRAPADAGASIRELSHDRVFAGPDVSRVAVRLLIETHDHARRVCEDLGRHAFRATLEEHADGDARGAPPR